MGAQDLRILHVPVRSDRRFDDHSALDLGLLGDLWIDRLYVLDLRWPPDVAPALTGPEGASVFGGGRGPGLPGIPISAPGTVAPLPSTALNNWVVSGVWCSGAMSAGASSGAAVWLMMVVGCSICVARTGEGGGGGGGATEANANITGVAGAGRAAVRRVG
jgi:hypothetical protein